MKTKCFIGVIFTLLSISIIAQVPQNVKDSFKNKYPNATIKRFQNEHNKYVATFVSAGKKFKATFSENGNWIQTETHKMWKEMPSAVRTGLIKSNYHGWIVYGSYQVETPEGTIFSFEVNSQYLYEPDKAPAFAGDYFVYFSPSGSIIKEEKVY